MTQHAARPPKVEPHTLDNGLTVVAVPNHTAPLVGVNLWYAVGSRDEQVGRTGFAHLFEHLMFQGSRDVPGTSHFAHVQGVGGSLNGTTSFDRTNYYETVPRHAAELGLWLEANRMATLLEAVNQESLDNQRDVVKNERRQRYDNVPYGTAWEELFAATFPVGHPYHHMPIGSMEDLDAADLADVHAFFTRHYTPGNAVLTVAGDISVDEVFELAEKHFGGIPRQERPGRREIAPIGALAETTRITLEEDVPFEKLHLAWRVPPIGTRENLALNLALAVLTEGSSARLNTRMVRKDESAHSIEGFTTGLAAGVDLAALTVTVRPDRTLQEVETTVDEELTRLATDGPSALELERAKAQHARHVLDTLSSVESLADEVGKATTLFKEPNWPFEQATAAAGLDATDVQQAAGLLLQPRTILQYTLNGKADR